jgi:hypothetical protein
MPRKLEEEVREAQRAVGRQFARERQPSTQQSRGIALSPIPVEVKATVTLYSRPLNNTLIVGHPDGSTHGWGAGELGDGRGSWTQVEQSTEQLPRSGRATLAESLASQVRATTMRLDGVDRTASVLDDAADTARAREAFPFSVAASGPALRSSGDVLIADGSFAAGADQTVEYRVDVSLTFSAAPRSTDEAVLSLAPISEAIRDSETVLAGIALGTDGSSPSASDPGLGNEVIRTDGDANAIGPPCNLTAILFRSEPSSQPVDFEELAVLDDDGNEVTRSVFSPERKDSRVRLRARSGIRFIET